MGGIKPTEESSLAGVVDINSSGEKVARSHSSDQPSIQHVTSDFTSLSDIFPVPSTDYPTFDYHDRPYAEDVFGGRTELVEVNDLFRCFGGDEMVTRFNTAFEKAEQSISLSTIDAVLLEKQLLECLKQESRTDLNDITGTSDGYETTADSDEDEIMVSSLDPADGEESKNDPLDVFIGDVYWMEHVADLVNTPVHGQVCC